MNTASQQGTGEATETAPDEQNGAAPQSPSGWMFFHQHAVMLQLREPYIGVNYPSYTPVVTDGGVRATQTIGGVLFVEPNGSGGYMLLLRVNLEKDFILITIQPDNVEFCTHVVESKIVHP